MKQFTLRKNIFFLIGLSFLGVAVTLIQQTNLGMSAWDAFNRNLYEGIPLEYKYLNPLVAMVIISIAYLIQKKKPSLWMLFPLVISFYIGLVIDLLLQVIPSVVEMGLLYNIGYLAMAIVICAIGLNFVLYCNYPLPALDEFCYALSVKMKTTFGKGKLVGEMIAILLSVIAGLIFSFQEEWFFIGPTTIIFGLFIGYAVDLFKKPIHKGLDKIK
ncbi:MAG: hypothetical protein PHC62_02085 [Candidatus Izemoplasmatales bacterium]|jgi:uncharacterized membrane protein YczE|nr:hypothetical protein [Candidatus Izemoplasmatales bacterium]